MKSNTRINQQILLYSLLVLIVPMILYPQLKSSMVRASVFYVILEIGYYFSVAYFLNRKAKFIHVVQAAGVCLLFRISLGAVLGLLLAGLYIIPVKTALIIAIVKFLPAVILHTGVSPFILKPIIEQVLVVPRVPRHIPQPGSRQPLVSPTQSSSVFNSNTTVFPSKEQRATQPMSGKPSYEPTPQAQKDDMNGFDMASRYIAEDASVQLVVIVDNEGLPLSNVVRGAIDVEDWAPMALLLHEQNSQVLNRWGLVAPERISLTIDENRIIISREESFSLMVISKRQPNDILDIRISKGLNIIKKYVDERYGGSLVVNTESVYA